MLSYDEICIIVLMIILIVLFFLEFRSHPESFTQTQTNLQQLQQIISTSTQSYTSLQNSNFQASQLLQNILTSPDVTQSPQLKGTLTGIQQSLANSNQSLTQGIQITTGILQTLTQAQATAVPPTVAPTSPPNVKPSVVQQVIATLAPALAAPVIVPSAAATPQTRPGMSGPFTGSQALTVGKTLWSPSGKYYMTLQPDSNLVIYSSAGQLMWSSNTTGKGAVGMMNNGSGLLMYPNSGKPFWQINTPPERYAPPNSINIEPNYGFMNDDGSFTIEKQSRTKTYWSTVTDPKRNDVGK